MLNFDFFDHEKAHPWVEPRLLFWHILRQCPWWRLGWWVMTIIYRV